jgi:hypothetical protein
MDTDRNMLFSIVAPQGDLVRPDQFVAARSTWANRNQWLVALPMEIGLRARQSCRPRQQKECQRWFPRAPSSRASAHPAVGW